MLKMPKHVKQFQGSPAQIPKSVLNDDNDKSPARLNEKTKKTLLGQGVQENNSLMLSLTSVNGVPMSKSPENYSDQVEDDVLVYEPTEA